MGVVIDQVVAETQASLAPQQLEHTAAQPLNSPSPSFDSSGSAGQTEADSESDGAKFNSSMLSGDSLAAAKIRHSLAAAASQERRRRQILPKIAKEDRCGHCHHCRNPKLKKACITARNLQMKNLDEKEELPLFYKIADNKLNSKAVPLARPRPAAVSPQDAERQMLMDQINGYLVQVDSQVMIKPGKQQHFVDLMQRPQKGWAVRIFFLTTIAALPLADRTMLVTLADRKGLHVMHTWLKAASERTADAERFQLDVLKTLGALPVDMAALKQVPIGRTVNSLAKKDPSQKVKAAAAKVVQQWRRNVGMADSDAKRTRLLSVHPFSILSVVAHSNCQVKIVFSKLCGSTWGYSSFPILAKNGTSVTSQQSLASVLVVLFFPHAATAKVLYKHCQTVAAQSTFGCRGSVLNPLSPAKVCVAEVTVKPIIHACLSTTNNRV